MEIVVSRHSAIRFKERFRLFYSEPSMATEYNIKRLMVKLVNEGVRITWWERCPFYKNKVESTYGPTVAIQFKHGVFICTPLPGNKLIVRTTVKKFDPTKPLTADKR